MLSNLDLNLRYLGNDMTFFLLSPLFLVLLRRRPGVGAVALLGVALASVGARVATMWWWGFTPIHQIDLDNDGHVVSGGFGIGRWGEVL